ncbi:unnamed protein product [Blepharisma stoltei]|uniref:Peptidase M14 domain-containing protein n=1 Tax=Blepharisma stoltei TaxID=1481888 RepID=A0AAU9JZU4_9CILI|nr:unnamed protein product [Blepharisma stoltei]
MKQFGNDSGYGSEVSECTSEIPQLSKSPIIKESFQPKEDRLPDCIPLVKSGHSLEPDMLFGWRPTSILQNGPIPLCFTLDKISTQTAIFYGFRPQDSLELHECYSSPETYKFTINPVLRHAWNSIKKLGPANNAQPFKGMKEGLDIKDLIFSSCFESGNLDKVVKVKDDEYDLYLRTDSNSYGHNWWYYFKVENKWGEREIKFNIVNFSKKSSLYSQGMLPCIFDARNPNKGWLKGGYKVTYTQSKINQPQSRRIYYSLSFFYQFKENDSIYFAYSIPYKYSRLCKFLKDLEKSNLVKNEILCKSLSGVDVPILTITDFSQNIKPKETAFLTARVHPGETHGSWVMEGFLKFIVSDNEEAERLRKKIVFKIIPMLNPDGVILGNSRCSLTGEDLNRRFQSPDPRLHPVIHTLKNMIKNEKISFYFDFHAHSTKKGMFIYGPHYPLHSDKYISIKVLPKLFSERTEMFRYFSCKFKNDWSKRKAARLVIWKELKLPFVYTIETSSYGFLDSERNTIPFSEELLFSLGRKFSESLLEYIVIRNKFIKEKEAKKNERLKRKKRGKKANENIEKFTARSLLEIMNCIKDENIQEENNSETSESEDEENPEYEEQQNKINQKILKVMEKAKNLMGFKRKGSYSGLRLNKRENNHDGRTSKDKLPKNLSNMARSSSKIKKQRKIEEISNKFLLNEKLKMRPITSSKQQPKFREIPRLRQINGIQSIKPNAVDISFKRRYFVEHIPTRKKHYTEKNSESPLPRCGDFSDNEQNDIKNNRSTENFINKRISSRYVPSIGDDSPLTIETITRSVKRQKKEL